MNVFLIILAYLAGLFYLLWNADVPHQRSEEGMCPRCGIDLDGEETAIVRDGKRGEIEWIMCLACAEKSRRGPLWLWIFAGISALLVVAFLSAEP